MACKAGNMRKQKNPHPGTPTREHAPSLENLEVSRFSGAASPSLTSKVLFARFYRLQFDSNR